MHTKMFTNLNELITRTYTEQKLLQMLFERFIADNAVDHRITEPGNQRNYKI